MVREALAPGTAVGPRLDPPRPSSAPQIAAAGVAGAVPRSDAQPVPGSPDREGDALRGLDVDEQRLAVGAEGCAGELLPVPRGEGRAVPVQPVQGDVEDLAAARQAPQVVVNGAILAENERPPAIADRDVVREIEGVRPGR